MTAMAGPLGDPMRRMPGSDLAAYRSAGGGGPRSFRPLQAYEPSRAPPLRGPPFQQSMYAQPSISPSPATALGTFVPPSRQYPPGPTPIPRHPPSPSPYSSQQSESAHQRPVASYSGGYNYPQPSQGQMGPPPPSHVPYSTPIFPRHSGGPGESLPPMHGPASLQLPPIRPVPTGPIDPAITQEPRQTIPQSPRREQERTADGTQEPDPKRPKMDIQGILGPRHD